MRIISVLKSFDGLGKEAMWAAASAPPVADGLAPPFLGPAQNWT
ncbi:hypothetical protein [Streptomyces sp. PU-14G]